MAKTFTFGWITIVRMMLEKIFLTYRDKVYGFFIRNLSDSEIAKDLTQEIFYRLCKREEHLNKIEDINAYIFLMCRNMAINHINKASHEKKYKERLLYAWNNLQIRGKSQVDRNIESEYFQEILEQSLNHLSPQQKKIVLLSKQEGKSTQLIAQELGLSPNTVRNHLYRALKSLKATINPYTDFVVLVMVLLLI